MSEHSQPPFTSRGIRIHWSDVLKLVAWLLPIVGVVVMLYLTTVFATHDQLRQSVAPLESLPPRVEKLEEFKADQKAQQVATSATVGLIQQDISGLKAELRALKDESTRNTDRILQRLDTIGKHQ